MIGRRFGYLTVLEEVENLKNKNKRYRCRCDCGTEKLVFRSNLLSGAIESCGCQKKQKRQKKQQKEQKQRRKEEAKVAEKELNYRYIYGRINKLRDSIDYLRGKAPDEMTNGERLNYYMTMARIFELEALVSGGPQ